ncbi:MAG: indole-3-glycerol phosphate synthase TrpC [Anaerolineaceae bacterium]|nr:indole-3-glycerol phosphate synthase TrpC [Anaerolineaceae bacterium]
MSRLTEILDHKKIELAERMRIIPLAEVRIAAENSVHPLDFQAALKCQTGQCPRLIAEVKCASPSRGVLVKDFDHLKLAEVYRANGAAAISVLTDEKFFCGKLQYLKDIAALRPRIPVLRKDFILDEYQLYEARAAGASAVLLIVAALDPVQVRDLRESCEALGMHALIEAHAVDEVQIALDAGAKVLGINNRDLVTFNVNLETSLQLRGMIPKGVVVVAESGIFTKADVDKLALADVDAILVGEALVTAADTAQKVRELAG